MSTASPNHLVGAREQRRRHVERDSPNGCYGILDRVSASLWLDVCGPDHVAPLLNFIGDELAEFGGRGDEWCASKVG